MAVQSWPSIERAYIPLGRPAHWPTTDTVRHSGTQFLGGCRMTRYRRRRSARLEQAAGLARIGPVHAVGSAARVTVRSQRRSGPSLRRCSMPATHPIRTFGGSGLNVRKGLGVRSPLAQLCATSRYSSPINQASAYGARATRLLYEPDVGGDALELTETFIFMLPLIALGSADLRRH